VRLRSPSPVTICPPAKLLSPIGSAQVPHRATTRRQPAPASRDTPPHAQPQSPTARASASVYWSYS
jgi:hypothetical protein